MSIHLTICSVQSTVDELLRLFDCVCAFAHDSRCRRAQIGTVLSVGVALIFKILIASP